MLVYPITREPPAEALWLPTMGFSLLFPANNIVRQIGFTVISTAESGEPVIDAPQARSSWRGYGGDGCRGCR